MASSKGRILCTEDDLDTRDMLTKLLRDEGYEVVSPTDATQALSLAINERFDLLLLDNWMPGLSGIDLTREVRKQNTTIPILFCSGAASERDIQEGLKAGAQGYLVKPLGVDEIISEIERLIKPRARRATRIVRPSQNRKADV